MPNYKPLFKKKFIDDDCISFFYTSSHFIHKFFV